MSYSQHKKTAQDLGLRAALSKAIGLNPLFKYLSAFSLAYCI